MKYATTITHYATPITHYTEKKIPTSNAGVGECCWWSFGKAIPLFIETAGIGYGGMHTPQAENQFRREKKFIKIQRRALNPIGNML